MARQRLESYLRVHQTGRPHEQLDHAPAGPLNFARVRRGAGVNGLVLHRLELLEIERPIIQRARQPEPVLDQHGLARAIAFVHAANLRDRRVRLINHQQVILREKIEQGARARPRRPAGKVPRVILDAGAEPHFLHHLEVVFGAHLEALGFEQFPLLFELGDPFAQLRTYRQQRRPELFGRQDELLARINGNGLKRFERPARQRVEARQALDLVAEKLQPQTVFAAGGADFDGVAAHAELAASEFDVVARVEQIHQPAKQLLTRHFHSGADGDNHRLVILFAADAVDAGDARHDHHVLAREQRAHGREPQPLDLIVDAGILLDVGVGARDVGLGLVIIEVADEIFDRVLWEEALELGVELGRERFVVRNDQRRPIYVLNDIRERERLARAGDAQQHLMFGAGHQAGGQLRDRLRLVPGRLIR